MRTALVGRALLALGLVVGIVAGVGVLIGFEPSRLPPAILNIAAYKLTALTAAGLLAAGAVVHRYARRDEEGSAMKGTPRELGEGPAEEVASPDAREPERARMNRRADESPR